MYTVGVIIGRFQVPELHKAHKALFEQVLKKHDKLIVLLGVSPVKLTKNNPLDFLTRKLMIEKAYPGSVIMPIKDLGNDVLWAKEVDKIIEAAIGDNQAVLYGSRKSFIPAYKGHGRYETVDLPSSDAISGTAIREAASKEIRAERAFRIGITYASASKYAISYQTVDALIWDKLKDTGRIRILLARKNADPIGKWRYAGGFVSPSDDTLEEAVQREVAEEFGINLVVAKPKYVTSKRVPDWRYVGEADQILTALFSMQYQWGTPVASDDIDEFRWFFLDEIGPEGDLFIKEHKPMWESAFAYLNQL